MITDGERRIITVNRAFSRSTGYSFEEIAGLVEVEGLPSWLRCNRPLAWTVEVAPSA